MADAVKVIFAGGVENAILMILACVWAVMAGFLVVAILFARFFAALTCALRVEIMDAHIMLRRTNRRPEQLLYVHELLSCPDRCLHEGMITTAVEATHTETHHSYDLSVIARALGSWVETEFRDIVVQEQRRRFIGTLTKLLQKSRTQSRGGLAHPAKP